MSFDLRPGEYKTIEVKKGIPVKLIVNAKEKSINGCNETINIREYGIEYTFVSGENVIEFTPDKVGNFTYSCWMGMITDKIIVTE